MDEPIPEVVDDQGGAVDDEGNYVDTELGCDGASIENQDVCHASSRQVQQSDRPRPKCKHIWYPRFTGI